MDHSWTTAIKLKVNYNYMFFHFFCSWLTQLTEHKTKETVFKWIHSLGCAEHNFQPPCDLKADELTVRYALGDSSESWLSPCTPAAALECLIK